MFSTNASIKCKHRIDKLHFVFCYYILTWAGQGHESRTSKNESTGEGHNFLIQKSWIVGSSSSDLLSIRSLKRKTNMPPVDTFVQSYGRSNQINSCMYRWMDWISKSFVKYLRIFVRYSVACVYQSQVNRCTLYPLQLLSYDCCKVYFDFHSRM